MSHSLRRRARQQSFVSEDTPPLLGQLRRQYRRVSFQLRFPPICIYALMFKLKRWLIICHVYIASGKI